MGPWPVREVTEFPDILKAAEDVLTWGFPRPIYQHELEAGAWFRMGKGVVWWYEPPQECTEPGDLWIHFAVAQRVRHVWPIRRWMTATQIIAELVGGERLVFSPTKGCPEISEYAIRAGWKADKNGRLLLPLGGEARWESRRRLRS